MIGYLGGIIVSIILLYGIYHFIVEIVGTDIIYTIGIVGLVFLVISIIFGSE